MSDDLLRYYNSELQYVRRLGDQFARAHPQVAPNLRFGTDGDYDPYVGRLVEAGPARELFANPCHETSAMYISGGRG